MEAPHGTLPVGLVVAGVQKAATSTLYRLLVNHQRIARAPQKEWHYFDDDGRDWATPDLSDYLVARRSPKGRATMSVDATPSYLFWPGAIERIHAWNPDVPLVMSFRDPVERAFSHWVMNWSRRLPEDERKPFAETVRVDYPASWIGTKPAGWSDKDIRTGSVVGRGLYGAQLARTLEVFPAEQMKLLDFHVMVRHQHRTAEELVAWLGLPPYKKENEDLARSPSRTDLEGEPPTADDVKVLMEAYADDLPLFTRLSGLDTSGWTTSRLLAGDLDPAEVAEKLGRKSGLIR